MCLLRIQRISQNQIPVDIIIAKCAGINMKIKQMHPEAILIHFWKEDYSICSIRHLLLHDVSSSMWLCACASNVKWIEVVDGRCIDKLIIFGLNRMTLNEKIGHKVKRRTMKKWNAANLSNSASERAPINWMRAGDITASSTRPLFFRVRNWSHRARKRGYYRTKPTPNSTDGAIHMQRQAIHLNLR